MKRSELINVIYEYQKQQEELNNINYKKVQMRNKHICCKLSGTGGAVIGAIQTTGLLLITSGIMSCYAIKRRKGGLVEMTS